MNKIIKEKSTDNVIKLNKALEQSLHDVDREIIIRLDKSIPLINDIGKHLIKACLLYTSPSPRDSFRSRMPSSA